jgi:hypothetical protein
MRITAVLLCCFFVFLAGACSRSPSPASSERSASSEKRPRAVSVDDLGVSQVNAPGVEQTFHRMGAGEVDETGWCRATSTDGGFSVSLPNVFNDFTVTTKAVDGVQVQTFILGTRNDRLVKFVAFAVRRQDGKFGPKLVGNKDGDLLQQFADDFKQQGYLQSQRRITLGEINGIELRMASQEQNGIFRIYQAPTTLYQLIVAAPKSVPMAEMDGDAKQFLDSFALPPKVGE